MDSGTKFPDIFAALAGPFEPHEIKQRQQGGKQLSYVTARTIANRLDSVLGPENWRQEFTETKDGMRCRIWFRIPGDPSGEWSWKEDGGGFAGMTAQDDDQKSAYSDSFKRAAAMLGPGRDLYRDGYASFVNVPASHPQPQRQPDRQSQDDGWPEPARGAVNVDSQRATSAGNGNYGPPRTGKGLFAWCKDQEQKHDVALLKYLNNFAKLQDWPSRMVDFDEDQVRLCYEEGVRKLESVTGSPAPSGSSPDGGARHPRPGDDIQTLREELSRLVKDVAFGLYGASEGEALIADMQSVLRAVQKRHPEQKAIYSLRTNGDIDLIRFYIGECVTWLADIRSMPPMEAAS